MNIYTYGIIYVTFKDRLASIPNKAGNFLCPL